MSNTIVTLKEIARAALPHLQSNLVFPKLVHSDFSADTNRKLGDTIRIRRPVNYVAKEFDAEAGVETQDVYEESVEVKLDRIATVDIEISAVDGAMSFDSVDRLFIMPAAIALAEKINEDGLKLYKQVSSCLGTPRTTPCTLEDLANVRRVMNEAKIPQHPRYAVWDTAADTAFATIPSLVNAEKSGSTDALRDGSIGRVFGIENFMSQAVVKHEGALTANTGMKVGTMVQAGATSLTVSGTTLTGRLVAGDILIIKEKNYTVTEDTAAASNNTISNVKVYPALEAVAPGADIIYLGAHTANLAFHPSAFAFVSRPLATPAGVDSYVTNFDGISLRVVRGYDMKYKKELLSMDILYAYKAIYPELAVRCLG